MYLGLMGWAIRLSALSAKHGNLKYQLHLFFNCIGGKNFPIISKNNFASLALQGCSRIRQPSITSNFQHHLPKAEEKEEEDQLYYHNKIY